MSPDWNDIDVDPEDEGIPERSFSEWSRIPRIRSRERRVACLAGMPHECAIDEARDLSDTASMIVDNFLEPAFPERLSSSIDLRYSLQMPARR